MSPTVKSGWSRMTKFVRRYVVFFVACAAISALHGFGFLWPIDRLFVDLGFALSKREASKHLVLVQIDPASIKDVGVWPWPRSIHAALLKKLLAADVTEIGYDVDFSSRSTPDQDLVLAEVLNAANTKVILAAFRQRQATNSPAVLTIDTLPLPMFREHVQLGNVIFRPASDGLIRTMTVNAPWRGGAMPGMSALLVGPAALGQSPFHIDFGIDISTVPRVSAIDLLEGRVPREMLHGKKVIVGAAATELGDQHAVPVYTRLHGMELQALAFESMVQGRTLKVIQAPVVIAVLLLLALFLISRRQTDRWQPAMVLGGVLAIAAGILVIMLQVSLATIFPATAVLLVLASFVLHMAYRDLWTNAILIFRQRMSLIHQRAFLEEILEHSFDGIIVTDDRGRIAAHNNAAVALLKAPDNDLKERPLNDFIPDAQAFSAASSDTCPKFRVRPEPVVIHFRPEDADAYHLEFAQGYFYRKVSQRSHAERRDEDRRFNTYIFRDVTARIERENARDLETKKAIQENRAKSEVLANMSHELRTPLNAILGFSEVMKGEFLGPIPEAYQSYADGIHESGKHLLNLVDEVLDVVRIDGGEVPIDDRLIDISKALGNCMQIVLGWKETHTRFMNVDLADDLPRVKGNERLLKQCVINILSNSVKYSGEGDSISLSAYCDADTNLVIEVRDTGIGIEPGDLEMIVKPFYRAGGSGTRDKASSLGLGLALVDSYTRAHDGRLDIFSRSGNGTTVRMILPPSRLFTETPPEDAQSDGHADVESNVVNLTVSR